MSALNETIVKFEVNGKEHSVQAPPMARLLDVLREDLGFFGTKEGCGEGECGSCTILLDGEPVNACLVAIGQCDGRDLVTVEGLGADCIEKELKEFHREELGRLLTAAGADAKVDEFKRYGSARRLYNFNIDNAGAY
jgi:xanthine dehydrogenase iron-sulfur cluster and FAD-binding subunit A